MNPQSCVCQSGDLNLAKDLLAQGNIHIFIVLNLRDFIAKDSRKNFERLRGGHAFGKALKMLKPKMYFDEDLDENSTVVRGHDFQVFRGHVRDDWLFPTFFLNPEHAPAPEDPSLQDELKNFELRIRLSRMGFLEVKLTRPIPAFNETGSSERIIETLRNLLEIGSSKGTYHTTSSLQLKLALFCADLFLRELPTVIDIEELENDTNLLEKTPIFVTPLGSDPEHLPFRQRYTILFLHSILCGKCGQRVNARKLWERDQKTLAAILEGALIEDDNGELAFPELDEESVKLDDLATWEEELCIFAPERCLIYYPLKNIYLPGQFAPEPVKYEHYWKSIVRGIEHTIAVRAALQIVEWYTTRDLNEVPLLTKKVVDGEISESDVQEITQMAQKVSNTFNMLPALRDVLIPTSSFRASYAVNKFAHLGKVLHLETIQEHVQRNVDELVIFLQYFSSMQLEEDLSKGEQTISHISVIIAIVALLVVGPSFLQDFRSFFVENYDWPEWTTWLFFVPVGVTVIALIAYLRDPESTNRILTRFKQAVRQAIKKRDKTG